MKTAKKSILATLITVLVISLTGAIITFFASPAIIVSAASDGYAVPETQNGSVFKETTAIIKGLGSPWWYGDSAWSYNEAENEWFMEGSDNYLSFGFSTAENTGSVTFEYKLDYDPSVVPTGEQTFEVLTWDDISNTDNATQLSLYPGLTLGDNAWDGKWHKFTITLPLIQHPASPQIAFLGYQTPGLYMRVRGLPLPEECYESNITASVAENCKEMGSILYKGQKAQTQTAKKYNLDIFNISDEDMYSITTFKAVANSGYIFIGWQDENGETVTTETTLTTDPNSSIADYKAVFKKPEGTVQDHLNVDTENPVTVLNEGIWGTGGTTKDDRQPWIIDPEHSTEEYVAYMAPNSYVKYPDGVGCYNIGFKFIGSGVLTFDIKLLAKGRFEDPVEWRYCNGFTYYYNKPINRYVDGEPGSGDSHYQNDDEKGEICGWPLFRGNKCENPATYGDSSRWEVPYKDCIIINEKEKENGVIGELIEDGWVRCYIPYTAESEVATNIIYIAYSVRAKFGDEWLDDYASIRNVSFNKGNAYLKTEVTGGDAAGKITYTSTNDLTDDVENGKIVPIGTKFEFTAEVNDGYEFYAWKDTEGRIVSYDSAYSYTLNEKNKHYKITAVIEPKGKYVARNGNDFYEDLQTALTNAKFGDNVYLLQGELDGEATVGVGVNLILPLNLNGDYYLSGDNGENDSQAYISWSTPELEKKYKYREFTIAEGAKLHIKGNFYVGGVLHFGPTQTAQAHTSGAYSELINNGDIVIESGGKMDVNGRVTGSGGIEVMSGGNLYQPFLILDYSGGTNTQGLFKNNQTPFNRYAMVNIQCKRGYKINYGGMLWGHASLYFMKSATTIDQPFISYETAPADKQSLINLKSSNTYAVGVYEDAHYVGDKNSTNNTFPIGRTTLTLHGGAYAGYMSFPMDINTKSVMFSIPYNYNIILEDGNFDLKCAFKLMPGATLTVKKGATLNLHANFYVYDGLVQGAMSGKTYPTAAELTKAGYSTNANFIVNGTLVIGGNTTGSYPYFSGLVQTEELGAVIDTTHIYDSYLQEREIVDGGRTSYDANTAKFKSTPRIYNAAKKTIVRIQGQKKYVSSCASAEEWVLPATTVTYARNLTSDEIKQLYKDGKAKPWKTKQQLIDEGIYYTLFATDLQPTWNSAETEISYQGHQWATGETAPVTLTSGGWMIEHSNHTFEWDETSSNTYNYGVDEEGVSQETRYCDSLGCLEHQTYSILHIKPDLFGWGDDHYGKIHVPYLGREYTLEDLKKIVDPYFEGYDFVDGFSYSINVPSTWNKGVPIKDVSATYYSFQVVYTNGRYYNEYDTYLESYSQIRIIIDPADISELESSEELTAEIVGSYTYNGIVQSPNLSIKRGDITLIKGQDYTVSCTDINAGTATGTVSGTGNYTGSIQVQFTISPKPITVTVKDQTAATYDRKEHHPENGTAYWSAAGDAICAVDKNNTAKFDITLSGGGTDAQDYDITATVVGTSEDNYTVTFVNGSGEEKPAKFTIKPADITGVKVNKGSYVYTGSEIEPDITVSAGSLTLTDGEYTLKFDEGKGVNVDGNNSFTVTGTGNFQGTATGTVAITPKPIDDAEAKVTTAPETIIYNGQPWELGENLEISVTLEGFEKLDYTVSYSEDHTNAGVVTITLTGTGNFGGNKEVTFTILQKNIAGAEITVNGEQVYTGEQLTPADLTVTVAGLTVTYEEEIEYGENINVDDGGTVTVTGNGNFTGTATGHFDITPATISELTVNKEYTYTGKKIEPEKSEVTVKTDNGLTLTESDFTLTYGDNTETTAEASVTAKAASSNYQGEITKNFTINKKNISDGVITFTDGDSYEYNGSAQTPAYTFTIVGFETVDLEEPEYTENTDVTESAKLTLTGTGNFTGTASKTFSITPLSLSGATVEIETPDGGFVYKAAKWEPKVTSVKLTVGGQDKILTVTSDYTVTYGDNTNVSDESKVIITGNGNFKDIAEKTFEITAKDITGATVTYDEAGGFVYKYAEYTPAVTSVVTSDHMSVDSQYYTVSYSNNQNAGAATITVEGNTNFCGTATATFEITQKSATITVKGGNIAIGVEPSEFTIIISGFYGDYNEQSLTALLDFEVIAPENLSVDNKYTVKASFKADQEPANYKVDFTDGEFVIVREGFEHVEFVGELKVSYDGKTHSLTLTGLPDGAEYELTYTKDGGEGSTEAPKAAGVYKVTAKVTLENGAIYTELSPATLTISQKTITVTLTNQSVVYNGKPQSAASAEKTDWSMEEGAIVENDEVIITLTATLTDVGNVKIEGSASGRDVDNYDVRFTSATFSVTEKDITGAQVKVDGEYTYTGTQIQPEKGKISATVDGLTITFDDTITYGNNVTVDDGGTVKITGNGNFTGTAEGKFTIKPATVTFSLTENEYEYTGSQIKPEVSVTWNGGTALEKGKYDLTYGKNINVSDDDISVSIELKDTNFTIAEDSKKLTFTIDPKDISTATVEVSESYTYTGTQIQPGKDKISATVDGLPVTFNEEIKYGENINVNGGGSVTITGNGNFTGTAEGEFKIKPATVTFSLTKNEYEYTGSQIQPGVSVTWNDGTVLEEGKYTLTYGDNTNVSDEDISVSIELNDNNFTIDKAAGTLKFTITAKSITDIVTIKITTAADEIIYKAAQWQPEFTVTASGFENFSSSDYNVSYGDNKNAGEGKIIITGKGNFKDAAEETFTIKQNDLSGATVKVTTPANTLIYKNAQWQPEISVTVNGITSALTKENDYTVQYGENKSAGENAGTITVNGNGNFTGTANVTFTILQKELTLNLKPQTAEYNGTEQSVSGDSRWWEATGGVERDDLEVVLSGSRKNVGDTQITVESVNSNYKLANNPSAIFTITPKSITITVQNQTAEYSNSEPNVDQSLWSDNGGICDGDERNVTLTKIPGVTHGDYELTGSYSNENYKVTFVNEANEEKPATFTITKKKVTVTVAPKGSVYGDELAELTYTYEGVISGDGFDIKDYIEISTTATQYSDVSGSYTISVKLKGEEAQNYEIDCTSTAAYTLTARPVKYTLDKQSSEYNGEVPQVAQKYTLKEGTVVNNDDLGITVKATELKKDAGTYVLTGDWQNKNYAVEFEAGEYEITKRDISENIMISVNEETNADDRGNIIAQYNGEPLSVHGMAYSDIDVDEELEITVTTDVTEIIKMGNYTVKATVEDKNYKGEKVFTVIVSDEKGYTENIYNVLEELEEKTAGINPDELKEEDFEVLKEARKLIDSLTEEEQETAREELAEYEQLIEAWNNATEADGNVIATAKTIADAPVSALIAASVSAIAVLAYVIGKGGRLI